MNLWRFQEAVSPEMFGNRLYLRYHCAVLDLASTCLCTCKSHPSRHLELWIILCPFQSRCLDKTSCLSRQGCCQGPPQPACNFQARQCFSRRSFVLTWHTHSKCPGSARACCTPHMQVMCQSGHKCQGKRTTGRPACCAWHAGPCSRCGAPLPLALTAHCPCAACRTKFSSQGSGGRATQWVTSPECGSRCQPAVSSALSQVTKPRDQRGCCCACHQDQQPVRVGSRLGTLLSAAVTVWFARAAVVAAWVDGAWVV